MATIVTPESQATTPPPNDIGVTLDGILNFFMNPVFLFIFAIIVIAIVIIVFFVMKSKKEDSLRERDDINYALYKQALRSSLQNQNTDWIKKTYSLKNLLILGIPLFWNEHSLQVYDINRVRIGWYRGHTVTSLGETIFCLYKKKTWFIFDDLFLVRTMNTHNYIIRKEILDKKGQPTGKYTETEQLVNFNALYEWLPQNVPTRFKTELHIQCDGISQDGYFNIPNYLRKDLSGKIISDDLKPLFHKNLIEYTREEQLLRSITDLSRNIDESARSNPHVAIGRHRIEKTEEEVRRDEQTPDQSRKSL